MTFELFLKIATPVVSVCAFTLALISYRHNKDKALQDIRISTAKLLSETKVVCLEAKSDARSQKNEMKSLAESIRGTFKEVVDDKAECLVLVLEAEEVQLERYLTYLTDASERLKFEDPKKLMELTLNLFEINGKCRDLVRGRAKHKEKIEEFRKTTDPKLGSSGTFPPSQ